MITGKTARSMRLLAAMMASTAFTGVAHAQATDDADLRVQIQALTAAIEKLQENQAALEARLAEKEEAGAALAEPSPQAPAQMARAEPAEPATAAEPERRPDAGAAPVVTAELDSPLGTERRQGDILGTVYAGPGIIEPNPQARRVVAGKGLSFRVPGTDTTIRLGGLIKVDAFSDLSGANLNVVPTDAAAIPINGTAQANRNGHFMMTARQSRFFLGAETDTSLGKVDALVEVDFYGTGGIALLTNPVSPRLRNAYVSVGKVLVGQAFSVFFDLAAAPETLDLTGSVGNGFAIRQPLIRYQTPLGRSGTLTLGIENPEGDFLGADHTSNYPVGAAMSSRVLNQAPDLTARYTWSNDRLRISTAGVLRFINLDTGGASLPFVGPDGDFNFAGSASTVGFGGQVNATLKTFGQDTLSLQANGGPGIGRYMTIPQAISFAQGVAPNGARNSNAGNGAVLGTDGKLRPITSYGATAWYRHYWSDTLRSNITAGHERIENPDNSLPLNYPERLTTLHANLLWNPIPQLGLGIEYVHGYLGLRGQTEANRALGIEDHGELNRVQVSVQYNLF